MANSADPDQLASSDLDLHCLQRQDISGFSRTRVKILDFNLYWTCLVELWPKMRLGSVFDPEAKKQSLQWKHPGSPLLQNLSSEGYDLYLLG